jgi:hypothetical protein
MGRKLLEDVWAWRIWNAGELLLVVALADFADDESRSCCPSVDALAARTQSGRRQVQRRLRHLQALGVIAIVAQGGRRPSIYRLNEPPARGVTGDAGVTHDVSPGPPLEQLGGSPLSPTPPISSFGDLLSFGDLPGGERRARPPRRAPRTPLPEYYPIGTRELAFALEGGFSEEQAHEQWALFLAYHRAHGSIMADWFQAWCTWLRREAQFRRERQLRLVR